MPFNILIVDDSATTRGLIRRALLLADLPVAEIYEAPQGIAALEQMRTNHVDLVLADLHMPEMGGMELAHAIMADPVLRTTPIAVISAEHSMSRIVALRQAGVKGYLRKPCTPESLRDLVQPFMEAHHA